MEESKSNNRQGLSSWAKSKITKPNTGEKIGTLEIRSTYAWNTSATENSQ